ncbi:MAG: alpha/beta hydrolase [Lachnoclostridium sp.]|nr:alpha/beta hydrolase [Lachnoclostridium sp.]
MKTLRYLLATLVMVASLSASAQWTPTKKVLDIATPKMKVFLPKDELNNGRAIVACPGGSYLGHAVGHEGWDWAPYFNKQGITYIVLEYALPAGDRTKPIGDAEAALKIVRDSAEVWHVNPADIGIMGSSAGGHLASTIATHSAPDVRPAFQILFYPVISMDAELGHVLTHDNFLGKDASAELVEEYSNDKQVTKDTPRAIILCSDDDMVNPATNAAPYYIALHQAGVPAALHIYPTGEHGWGILNSFQHHTQMLDDLSAWLATF